MTDPRELIPEAERFSDLRAYILAGGRATRMGGVNKALLAVAGRPLIEHMLAVLAPRMPVTVLSAREADFAPFGVRVIPDLRPDLGPLGGIETGLADSDRPYNLFVPCDMPGLSWDVLEPLCRECRGYDLTLYRHDRHEPLVAVYARSCLPHVRALLDAGLRRPIELLARVRARELAAPDPRVFRNLNRPEDLGIG